MKSLKCYFFFEIMTFAINLDAVFKKNVLLWIFACISWIFKLAAFFLQRRNMVFATLLR